MLGKRDGGINFDEAVEGLDALEDSLVADNEPVKNQQEASAPSPAADNSLAGASGAGMIKDKRYYATMKRLGKQTTSAIKEASSAKYLSSIQETIDFLCLKTRADIKLGVKQKTDCLQLIAPKVDLIDDGKCTINLSKTGDVLSSNFCVSLIYLSSERIYVYKYQGSTFNELCTENVYEFLYSDITGINIENKIINIESDGNNAPAESQETAKNANKKKRVGVANVSFIELYHGSGSVKLPIQPDSDIRDGKFALLRRVIRDKRNF